NKSTGHRAVRQGSLAGQANGPSYGPLARLHYSRKASQSGWEKRLRYLAPTAREKGLLSVRQCVASPGDLGQPAAPPAGGLVVFRRRLIPRAEGAVPRTACCECLPERQKDRVPLGQAIVGEARVDVATRPVTHYTGMASRSISIFETRYPARSTSEIAEEIAACNDSAVRSNSSSMPSACPRIDASVHPALPSTSVVSRISSNVIGPVGIITEN